MPRSGSGTYTLPSGNPVVTGTTIETAWANNTLSDIATAMTDSLSRSGQGGMTAAFRAADGTSGLPGIAFTNETTTGLYRAGSADLRLAITTNLVQQWLATGTAVTGTFTVSGNTTISNLTASKVVFTDGSKVLTSTGTVGVDQGGTGATTASAARTNLGSTTVGDNLYTLTNPSAITFLRINADNTVSALDASTFRTAIGAGTGGGDVTGPGSSTSGNIATFNGTTGKVIQDGGKALPAGSIVGTSDSQTLTSKTIEAGTFTNGYTEETVTANTSTAYTIDLANGSVQILTLTGNCVYTFPTATAGRSFLLIQKQDGTGGRTVTWPSVTNPVKWPNSAAPTITSTASKADVFAFTADGTNWFGRVIGQNYL